MKIPAALTALSIALAAAPAHAGEAVLAAPVQAGSLHEGTLDMVAYYVPAEDGHEVTATFAPRAHGGTAQRVVMLLADGDAVSFSIPGHASVLYRFERSGDAVTISAASPAFAVADAD